MAAIGQDITLAKQLLEKDELVAVPTETVYGLAANALSPTAVTKIFVAKNRPTFDPLIIHVASRDQLGRYVSEIPEHAQKLMEKFWPGPLTLLLPKKNIIPDIVTSGLETVGIRCPDHYLTHQLLSQIDFPLAAPSANPFGYVSPTTANHVNEQLGNRIAYILDGGPCKVGIESTIVGFEGGRPIIYRRGGISEEATEKVVGKTESRLHSTSNPKAPGQLESHYAPRKTFELGDIDTLIKKYEGKNIAILRFQKSDLPKANEFYLSESGDLAEAAKNLFSLMRKLDQMEIDAILTEKVPDIGIGRAINDRLIRAAAARH